jgi:hypothetical protein
MGLSESAPPTRQTLTFSSDTDDPFVPYAIDLAASVAGVTFTPSSDSVPDVYYGSDDRRPARMRIPHDTPYTTATVPGPPGRDEYEAAMHREEPFPFDLFAALRFWLTDHGNEELPPDAYDAHDRLRPEHSTQEVRGVREVPIVNAYLLLFRHWLRSRLEATVTPRRRRCTVVLSHDVDSAVDPIDPRNALAAAARGLRGGVPLGRSARGAAAAIARAAFAWTTDPRGRHALFDALVEAEESRGLRSTFFFAATSRFDPDGSRRDVAYDVGRPPVRDACRRLAERGVEIGLHVGYEARADSRRIAAEAARLADVARTPVLGSRHHYWHLSRPMWGSLEAHAAAGLRFDSSVSFEDAPGYRLGTALPFRPWDPTAGRPVATLQVPTLLMDSMLLLRPDSSVETAVAEAVRLLDILKEHEGVAAIDWHEYTSLPTSRRYRAWGETYLALLDVVASDNEIRTASFADLLDDKSPSYLPRIK